MADSISLGTFATKEKVQALETVVSNLSSSVNDAFLSAGQSNEAGNYTPITAGYITGIPQITVFGNDYVFRQAEEPLDSITGQVDVVSQETAGINSTTGHGSALKAMKDLYAARGGRYTIIPSAMGGTSVENWQPSATNIFDRSTLFGSALYRAAGTIANGRTLRALLWTQGEANASNGSTSTYRNYFKTMLDAFRDNLDRKNLPCIYTQLGIYDTAAAGFATLREIQRKMEHASGFSESILRCYMVCAHDLPVLDGIHYTMDGKIELGRRRALAIRQHIYLEQIDGTGPRLVTVTKPTTTTVKVKTTKVINNHATYDNYFTVYDGGVAKTISSISRDPSDTTAVLITVSSAFTGAVTVDYQPPVGRGNNTWASNVVKEQANLLPLPCFSGMVAT